MLKRHKQARIIKKSVFLVWPFKAAPWDDINFRFNFCNEVVYPPDHDFFQSF